MVSSSRLIFYLSLSAVLLVAGEAEAQTVINTVAELQNIQANLSGSYVLGGNIDASPTSSANGGTGFIPIGSAAAPFTGTFDGKGYKITGLTINSALAQVGLFGQTSQAAIIQNVELSQVAITATASGGAVGSLVGRLNGSVLNCGSTGTITGSSSAYIGGLVGWSYGGGISYSTSSVVVSSTTSGGDLGGLVGYSESVLGPISVLTQASISNSKATGSVNGQSSGSGTASVGGLVGFNSAQITQSRAQGEVTGTGASMVGGLVGESNQQECPGSCNENFASITESYATGAVSTGLNGKGGGLIGLNLGLITESFAIGSVTDTAGGGDEGGLVGDNEGGSMMNCYATGTVSAPSSFAVGGLIGQNNYDNQSPIITACYSVGAVESTYSQHAGGLVGNSTTLTTVTDSYWDMATSLQTSSAVGTGLSTTQLQSGILPTGFSSSMWSDTLGSYPSLIACPAPISGYVNPKYQVVGVTYAPPGPSSSTYVQYLAGSIVGTSQTISQSFEQSNAVTATITGKAGTPASGTSGSISLQYSQMASQTVKNSSQITTNIQVQEGEKTSGTGNYFYPVDHDYDLIWIWLNPTVLLILYPAGSPGNSLTGSVDWNGYGFDTHDQSDVDIVGVPLGYLNGDFGQMPPQYQNAFSRAWAAYQMFGPGQAAALTAADLLQIATADPFSTAGYGLNYITYTPPSPNTADGRFTLSACNGTSGIPYTQSNPSGGAGTYTCTLTNTNTSMQTKDVTSSYSQTFSIDVSAQYAFADSISIGGELKDAYTLTWTTEDQTSTTDTTSTAASLSVQSPPCNNVVPGRGPCVPVYDVTFDQPTQFDVYQDNQYGTFMFAPVNYYTSNLTSSTGAPVFSPAAGTYSTKQSVTITDSTAGATVFYTTDGSQPSTSSAIYSSPISVSANETIRAIAIAADLTSSAASSATYSITTAATTATPTFSVAGGTYASAQTVLITDASVGATIYCTADGTGPTTSSSLCPGPITVSTSETIEAIAVAPGLATSSPGSATYVISAPSPDFKLTGSPSTLSIVAGKTGTAAFTIAPVNGFSSQVTFACGGLPYGASCTFSPASVTPSGTPAMSTLTIETAAQTASLSGRRPNASWRGTFALLLPSSAILLGLGGRRRGALRIRQGLIVLLSISALGALTACGGGTAISNVGASLGTPTGTDAITIVAVSSDANSTTHTTYLAVTITR